MKTEDMITAVRWYEGDVDDNTGPVFHDSRAYVTYNAVFFEGLENEKAKIREKKYLNPAFLQHCEEIYGDHSLTSHIMAAMENCPLSHPIDTYRVERLFDFQMMQKQHRTIAFTSTSKAGFLGDYTDKDGIVLMVFHLSPSILCLDLSAFLPEYKKSGEAEILLPPQLIMESKEVPLSDTDRTIVDMNGDPPRGKYEIDVHAENESQIDVKRPSPYIFTLAEKAISALNAGKMPQDNECHALLQCKAYCRFLALHTIAQHTKKRMS